jgi:tetratricopeptide (TPR) repeat protein
MKLVALTSIYVLLAISGSAHLQSTSIEDRLLHANAALIAGNVAEAEQLYSSALAQMQAEKVGGEPLATALYGLACTRNATGRCHEAADMALRAIRTLEKIPTPDPAEVSGAFQVLGTAYFCQRLYSKAEESYRKAMDLMDGNSAHDSTLAEILSNLGAAYTNQGRYRNAEAVLANSLAIMERNPPTDPVLLAMAQNNLGAVYRQLGRLVEAEAAFRSARPILERYPYHPLTAHVLANLATICIDTKRYQEAGSLLAKAVELIEGGLVLPSYETRSIFQTYAECLRRAGDKAEAKRIESKGKVILSALPADPQDGQVVDASQLIRRK